ncbi:MAG: ribose 5-phosphate isomerase B [Candidatus Melainabacteria bacterium]|nr:ribose 5-phosphate isomerase B [Candidatus Melainabacteria bacterium]
MTNQAKSRTIALGSDHAGFELKQAIRDLLIQQALNVEDFGTFSLESCDYPDYARKVAEAVSQGVCAKGILVCGSGVGVSIVANKVRKVRAALVSEVEAAILSRQHNDANVLCLGARTTSQGQAKEIIAAWLATEFEGGRHQRRINKIEQSRQGENLFG